MKKSGVINPALMEGLTSLFHLDKVVICDAGFPIPAGCKIVDLSITAGMPTVPVVLRAVLNEIAVESFCLVDGMKEKNPDYYGLIYNTLVKQQAEEIPFSEFLERARSAKLVIRTGDIHPASNILLVSASGTSANQLKYNITCPE